MPGSAALTLTHRHTACIGVEVMADHMDKLPIPTACEQCGLYQPPEVRGTGIDQPCSFIDGQVADLRCIHVVEWFNSPPSLITSYFPVMVSTVECRLEHRQD